MEAVTVMVIDNKQTLQTKFSLGNKSNDQKMFQNQEKSKNEDRDDYKKYLRQVTKKPFLS